MGEDRPYGVKRALLSEVEDDERVMVGAGVAGCQGAEFARAAAAAAAAFALAALTFSLLAVGA